jgi:uncharacterized RDD family membrane protein YckC
MEQSPDERRVALGAAVLAWRAGSRAARAALVPVRTVAGLAPVRGRVGELEATGREAELAARRRLESAAEAALATPEVERAVDQALAGSLPESVARSIGRHQVVERIARETVESGELDAALDRALASEHTDELVEKILGSPEFEAALRRVLSSPAVREALQRQAMGFGGELAGGVRGQAVRLDGAVERPPRRWFRRQPRSGPAGYGGLGSRGLGGAIDLTILALVYVIGGALIELVASLFGGTVKPHSLVVAIAGVSGFLLTTVYFVGCWSAVGQTPGMRVADLRVVTEDGRPPVVARSLLRLLGTYVAIVPLFAGFLPVLVDDRRRALQDWMARTVVVQGEGVRDAAAAAALTWVAQAPASGPAAHSS